MTAGEYVLIGVTVLVALQVNALLAVAGRWMQGVSEQLRAQAAWERRR